MTTFLINDLGTPVIKWLELSFVCIVVPKYSEPSIVTYSFIENGDSVYTPGYILTTYGLDADASIILSTASFTEVNSLPDIEFG